MAEEIKKQHLDFNAIGEDGISEIEMYNPDLQINETFRMNEIQEYARPRVEEIFLFVSKELRKYGKSSLPGGAVLIGGAANLEGIEQVAKEVLKNPIFKYAFDRNLVEFVPDYNDDPTFINCISLAAYALFHHDEFNLNQKVSKASFSSNNNSEEGGGVGGFFKKLLPWS